MPKKQIKIGIDQFEKLWPKRLKRSKVGLLVHGASVNRNLNHTIDLFINSKNFELKAIFGPQHGIFGETQDNMVEWEGFIEPRTGLPVFSLYGHTRKPEPSMLKDIDVFVIDLQDIGSRYYTFIWTMELCMQACNEYNKSLIILDRPNPIGGHLTEGPVLKSTYSSFVGQRPLPIRHGMTIGEIGNYFRNTFYNSLDFYIIPMKGWKRRMWFDETGLPWVMPSPNMPTLDTAMVYPGMCLLEGTNISEGRGTTRPFEIFGAPFIDPYNFVSYIKKFRLSGIIFRPIFFQPTFQKYAGKLCGGAQIHIIDREKFRPFKTGITILKTIYELYPKYFEWKKPPYEYENQKLPIDILAGTDKIRKEIEAGEKLESMEERWRDECNDFNKTLRKQYLIYK